ncbi:MAG: hypothetical protein JKX70_10040 [Phycisphaerales bacterium]|nr:hypothetical protein [Phycisphaerales bacterium]
MNKSTRTLITTLVIGSAAVASHADIIFQDDFESGLSLWTGKNDGAHHGFLTNDPLGGLNTVLAFNGLIAGGDMFSESPFSLESNQSYRMSFDYLGLANQNSNASDTGGYVGFSVGTAGNHRWMWATGSVSGADDVLIDDGAWHSYQFEFTTADLSLGSNVRLMIEDFSGSGGSAGDAFFDNFQIAAVPGPGAAALFGIGGVLVVSRRRRS